MIWDFEQPDQKVSNRPFYTKVIPSHPAAPVQLQVKHLAPNIAYRLQVYRAGFHANDAYTAYIEMGSPKELTKAEVSKLNDLTRDSSEMDRAVKSSSDGTIEVSIPMKSNDIVLINVERSQEGKLNQGDRDKSSR